MWIMNELSYLVVFESDSAGYVTLHLVVQEQHQSFEVIQFADHSGHGVHNSCSVSPESNGFLEFGLTQSLEVLEQILSAGTVFEIPGGGNEERVMMVKGGIGWEGARQVYNVDNW